MVSYFPQDLPKGNLEGSVRDQNTKMSLIGVNIYNSDKGIGTTTDEKGKFVFKNIPVGTYTIQFSYLGYDKVTVTDVIIRPNRTTYLNVEMNASSVELENVVVESGYFHHLENKPLGTVNFSSEEIRRAPGFCW